MNNLKLSKKDLFQIIENALVWIVTLAMSIYGIGKVVQFKGAAEINKTVNEMTGMELMWAFYGYSENYVLILGFLEVLGGLLLFFRKTRIIGCVLISTILINIILQDIFYKVNAGALRAAILYQMCIVAILWFNKEKVLTIINSFYINSVEFGLNKRTMFIYFLTFILFVILRYAEWLICSI
ncbi:hypothetical protein [Flavobacterium sp. H122]|uniref:hypothetical protein n=1 Tax=Flavobacterium sp. H122 TaxID=2529860 RepID=UPI0020BFAFC1|nr:hypothetical protein [Flavobacterium sp. H122]